MDNCPHQLVLVGNESATREAMEALHGKGGLCERLTWGRAYHSESFAPACRFVEHYFRSVGLRSPRMELWSCATADRYPAEPEAVLELAVRQWRTPVRFQETIRAMYDAGVRVFVEVGPRGHLSAFIKDTLADAPHVAVALDLPRKNGIEQLCHALGLLAAQGVAMRLEALYERRLPRPLDFKTEAPAERRPPILKLDENVMIDPPDGVVVLTDDGRGVARSLESSLRAVGARPVVLATEVLATPEGVVDAINDIRRQEGPIRGVVHLLPLQVAGTFPGVDEAEWTRHVDQEIKGALYLLQATAPELSAATSPKMFFACLTLGGGDFDEADASESVHPWRGGLAGLLKCAAREWERAKFRTIDLDDLPNGATAELLLREWAADGPVEVGYRGGRRLCLQPVRVELDDSEPSNPAVKLDRGSVILVTGGARGITAEIALELATRVRPTLVLLGRTPNPPSHEDPATAGITDPAALRRILLAQSRQALDHAFRGQGQAGREISPKELEAALHSLLSAREVRDTLRKLRDTGARAEYVAADVRDGAALERIVKDVRRRHGRIDAVIHGAGVIEDRAMTDKTAESFDRVVGTKIDPVLTLCRILDPREVKLLMLFASVAGFFGNPGQGDYAAANETLNRIARRLRPLWPGKIVAMNWGPWSGAGMVAPEVARQFEARGVGMVTTAAGRRATWQEITHRVGDGVRVLIGAGPWIESAERAASGRPAEAVETPLLSGHTVQIEGGVAVWHREQVP